MSEGSADPIIVFFSGSCRNNDLVDGAAGSGVWWGTEQPKNLAIRTPGKQTNNCSELFGLLSILEQIRRDDLENANNSDAFLINADRKYTFDCFTRHLPRWQVNNFSKPSGKGSIQNVELIRHIAALLEYVSLRHNVQLALVSSSENRQARLLAEQAVNLEKVQEVVWSDCRKEVEKKLALAREEINHKKAQMGHDVPNKKEEALESSEKRKKETKKKKVAQEMSVIAPDKADEGQSGRPKKDRKLKRKAKDVDVGQQQEVVIRAEEERPKKRMKRKFDAEETELEIESNSAQPPKLEKKKRTKKAAKVVIVLKIQVETKEKKHRQKEGREGKRRRHDQTE